MIALTMAGLLGTPAARADTNSDPDAQRAARAHFDKASELARGGDLAAAIPEYEAAFRARPHYLVQLYLAQAYSGVGRPVEALRALASYRELGADDPSESRRKLAARLAEENQSKVGRLVLEVTGEVTELTVDGEPVSAGTLALAAGRHVLAAAHPGHQPLMRVVLVKAGESERVTISLKPVESVERVAERHGAIEVSCAVPGVRLYLDDVPVGTTPLRAPVWAAVGKHRISAKREGYVGGTAVFEVEERSFTRVGCGVKPVSPQLPNRSALLTLVPALAAARVSVDAERWVPGQRVPHGPHRVRLELDGFMPWSGDVNLVPGELRLLAPTLVPTPERRRELRAAAVRQRRWALLTGGAGLAVAGAGAGLFVVNSGEYREWRRERDALVSEMVSRGPRSEDAARLDEITTRAGQLWRRDDLALGLVGGGAVLVTTGIVLWVRSQR